MTEPAPVAADCGICRLHSDPALPALLIHRGGPWLLRHHPLPSPLAGWLLLDSLRHVGGPDGFDDSESAQLGGMLRRCCDLVRQVSDCERVYCIAFGEGARHFHLHLIPRHASEPSTESWRVSDLYRAVMAGERSPAAGDEVASVVERARLLTADW